MYSVRESLHWFTFLLLFCCHPLSPVEVIWADNLHFNLSVENHYIYSQDAFSPEIRLILIIHMF